MSRDERARDGEESLVSPLEVELFRRRGRSALARHFDAIRLARSPRPDLQTAAGRPLLIYLNHSCFWDPLVCLELAQALMPERRHFSPTDGRGAGEHRLFSRLGFFPIEPDTALGARRFLDLSLRLLAQADTALWVAGDGRPRDPRERPAGRESVLGHLACRLREAIFLPLAIEYPFWDGQRPEALARFGEEISAADAGMRAASWSEVLGDRLTAAQDALAADALSRDAARFEVLLARRDAGDEAGGSSAAAGRLHRLRSWLTRRRPPAPRAQTETEPL